MVEFHSYRFEGAAGRSVHSVWWLRARRGDRDEWPRQWVFPYGCSELIISLSTPSMVEMAGRPGRFYHPPALLYGQATRPLTLFPVADELNILGVRLFPGGIRRCFGVRDRTFSHTFVEASDCPEPIYRIVRMVMEEGGSLQDSAAIVGNEVLVAWRKQPEPPDLTKFLEINALMRSTKGMISVSEAAGAAGWNMRQLQRSFSREIGVSPKRIARILRFQGVFHMLYREENTLAGAAASFGYTDQAHLTKDCRAITGYSPTEMQRICLDQFLIASRMTCY